MRKKYKMREQSHHEKCELTTPGLTHSSPFLVYLLSCPLFPSSSEWKASHLRHFLHHPQLWLNHGHIRCTSRRTKVCFQHHILRGRWNEQRLQPDQIAHVGTYLACQSAGAVPLDEAAPKVVSVTGSTQTSLGVHFLDQLMRQVSLPQETGFWFQTIGDDSAAELYQRGHTDRRDHLSSSLGNQRNVGRELLLFWQSDLAAKKSVTGNRKR